MLLKRLESQMPVSNIFCKFIFSVLPNPMIDFKKQVSMMPAHRAFEIARLESHYTPHSLADFKAKFCYLYTFRQKICNNCSGKVSEIPSQRSDYGQMTKWVLNPLLIGW